jgi:hypothetical protein
VAQAELAPQEVEHLAQALVGNRAAAAPSAAPSAASARPVAEGLAARSGLRLGRAHLGCPRLIRGLVRVRIELRLAVVVVGGDAFLGLARLDLAGVARLAAQVRIAGCEVATTILVPVAAAAAPAAPWPVADRSG